MQGRGKGLGVVNVFSSFRITNIDYSGVDINININISLYTRTASFKSPATKKFPTMLPVAEFPDQKPRTRPLLSYGNH